MTRDEWIVRAEACEKCDRPARYNGKPCMEHKLEYYRISGAPGLPANSKPNHSRDQSLHRPDQLNGWERGITTDDRGIPLISPTTGAPMRMKEYSENRHAVDARVKQLKSS